MSPVDISRHFRHEQPLAPTTANDLLIGANMVQTLTTAARRRVYQPGYPRRRTATFWKTELLPLSGAERRRRLIRVTG